MRWLLFLACLVPAHALASPWIEADDPFLRASIEQLAAAGYLEGHRTTYPLMWSGIARDLNEIDVATLSEEHRFAFYRVRSALEFSQRPVTRVLRAKLSTDSKSQDSHQHTFADTSHERAAITSGSSFTGNHWAGRLQTTFRADSADDKSYHFVGSYLATTIGNWALSVDQVPIWWGPGHENALVLSTNSLPFQTIRVNRLSDEPVPGIGWLGHVHGTAFVGRTQSSATLGDNFAGGTRVTLRPHERIEFGASYLAHWESIGDFYNQIAGIDGRFGLSQRFSVYGEVAANHRDADDLAYTLGVDASFAQNEYRIWQLYAEFTEVPALFYDRSAFIGEDIELDGYRRWDYNIGAGQDQDVKALSVGMRTQRADGRSWSVKIRRAEYGQTNWPIGLRYGRSTLEDVETYQVDVQHQRPWKDALVTLGVSYRVDDVTRRSSPLSGGVTQDKDLSLKASWEFRF